MGVRFNCRPFFQGMWGLRGDVGDAPLEAENRMESLRYGFVGPYGGGESRVEWRKSWEAAGRLPRAASVSDQSLTLAALSGDDR
jgi:hypothetical protein